MDKSWGGTGTSGFRVRTNDSAVDRAAKRAHEREARATERAAATSKRLEDRASAREIETAAQEQARIDRREREQQSTSGDPHAAAAKRHRTSGRKDVVKEQRDTLSYTTVVDESRIRELAKRGASLAGLAAAFGIAEAEIARLLAD